jgi:glycosyltransferase involved in cell wall biosynthesis
MPALCLIVPGQLDTLTGGYGYDRRMAEGLRACGWAVDVRELTGEFPFPSGRALAAAADVLASVPDEALVMVDGLAFGAMPEQAAKEGRRLRLVALVHHPLADETGLAQDAAARLESSERRALAAARRIVVTSRGTAANLARFDVSPDRIAIVEPGTDRAPIARGSGGPSVHLVCVAAVVPRKGHDVLLRALAAIRDLNWRLTCVGSADRDPAAAARVREFIERSRLDDRVSLVGERNAGGVAALYDEADVFVLPAFHEGYGMAVAEALARGLPVIGTPTGAIADLVEPGAGMLVPAGDVEALSAALARVISSAGTRESMAAAARGVRDRLPGWDAQAAKLAGVLSRV